MTADAYRERLYCPRSWYVTGALAGLVLAPEISFVTPLPFWSTALMGVVGATIIVLWISRHTLTVTDGELRVRGARLSVRYVDTVVGLEGRSMSRLLGRDGDPAAFLAVKPWITPGIQIVLDDPDDPVPYWAVSTRHPRDLADALVRARYAEETREPR